MLDRSSKTARLLPGLVSLFLAACTAGETAAPSDGSGNGEGTGGGAEVPKDSAACEAPAERFVASIQVPSFGQDPRSGGDQLECSRAQLSPGIPGSSWYSAQGIVLSSESPEEGTIVLELEGGTVVTASAPGLRALPPVGTLVEVLSIVRIEDPDHPERCRKELLVRNPPGPQGLPAPALGDGRIWFAGNVDQVRFMLGNFFGGEGGFESLEEATFGLSVIPEPECRGDANGCGVPGALELTPPDGEPVLVGLGETRAFSLPEGSPIAGDYEARNLASGTTAAWISEGRYAESCHFEPEYWIQRK